MRTEEVDQFVTCACGSSDHIIRLRSFYWHDNHGNPCGIDICVEILFNSERNFLQRIISAIKYIFGYKENRSLFHDIIIDDKNLDKMIEFLVDYKNKKDKYINS